MEGSIGNLTEAYFNHVRREEGTSNDEDNQEFIDRLRGWQNEWANLKESKHFQQSADDEEKESSLANRIDRSIKTE